MSSLATRFCFCGLTSKLKLFNAQNVVVVALLRLRQQPAVLVTRYMSEDSRLHSTDIAFKPAESGWGGGGKYANNFDAIFNKKKEKKETNNKDAGSTKKDEQ